MRKFLGEIYMKTRKQIEERITMIDEQIKCHQDNINHCEERLQNDGISSDEIKMFNDYVYTSKVSIRNLQSQKNVLMWVMEK